LLFNLRRFGGNSKSAAISIHLSEETTTTSKTVGIFQFEATIEAYPICFEETPVTCQGNYREKL